MYITTTGLVLRAVPYKESSAILTVLTASEGKITVSAKGAKRRGSKTATTAQPLAFSEMTLSGRDGRWTLAEAKCLELFEGLQSDVALLALGSYFAETMEAVSNEGQPNPEVLSLGLNALFVLSEGLKEKALVKAAFELRLMCLSGYEPDLTECAVCGKKEPENVFLSLTGGILRCGTCRGAEPGAEMALFPGALRAMRYVVSADAKKVFSFSLGGDAEKQFCAAAEAYLKVQLDRDFRTLDFYNRVNASAPKP